jgi:hypothetical protein
MLLLLHLFHHHRPSIHHYAAIAPCHVISPDKMMVGKGVKIPQIWKVYSAKNGAGLAPSMFLLEQFGYSSYLPQQLIMQTLIMHVLVTVI